MLHTDLSATLTDHVYGPTVIKSVYFTSFTARTRGISAATSKVPNLTLMTPLLSSSSLQTMGKRRRLIPNCFHFTQRLLESHTCLVPPNFRQVKVGRGRNEGPGFRWIVRSLAQRSHIPLCRHSWGCMMVLTRSLAAGYTGRGEPLQMTMTS